MFFNKHEGTLSPTFNAQALSRKTQLMLIIMNKNLTIFKETFILLIYAFNHHF